MIRKHTSRKKQYYPICQPSSTVSGYNCKSKASKCSGNCLRCVRYCQCGIKEIQGLVVLASIVESPPSKRSMRDIQEASADKENHVLECIRGVNCNVRLAMCTCGCLRCNQHRVCGTKEAEYRFYQNPDSKKNKPS
jgi:hypothetical protein